MSILDYVPKGFTLRPVQTKALLEIEAAWNNTDVFVMPGPVAMGKSLVLTTISLWQQSYGFGSSIITSQVLLQNQYARTPPYFPVLKGRSHYTCTAYEGENCETTKTAKGSYCAMCPYIAAREKALESKVGVFNFHSYLFNKAYKEILMVDEAHNLMSMIADYYTLKVWKHKTWYPQMNNKEDIALWLEGEIKEQAKQLKVLRKQEADASKIQTAASSLDKFKKIYWAIDSNPADFFVDQTTESYRGKQKPVLNIRPLNIRKIRHGLWPRAKVSKIILSSATFKKIDVEELGLHDRRVIQLECESPIAPKQRPFEFIPVANMSFKYQEKNLPKMAQFIKQLAAKHVDSKGVIHMPYSMSYMFKKFLTGKRYMWHDKKNKEAKLAEFMECKEPRILVACGMDQGIDLAGKEFGWQAIAKVQYPSLGDPIVKAQASDNPKWYAWQTIRTIEQQYGRICRTLDDYGITYMLDVSFRNLDPERGNHLDLWDNFFTEARVK